MKHIFANALKPTEILSSVQRSIAHVLSIPLRPTYDADTTQ
ncbi:MULTISPECIES: hypothetical protein [Sphingobacterium]|nr:MULTISPECIES: hypothetical protein [Sphingobacterium]